MATPWVFLLLVGILNLINQFDIVRAQLKPEYTLAFLGPAAASEIPTDLAIEWESAFKVAVEVENSKNRTYRLVPFEQYSDCDWQTAYHGADVIVKLDPATYAEVIGVVGPACSGAAMGSCSVVKTKNISMISFAATAEPITADREWFDNLFRTVYPDRYQAQAIAASISKLNMTAVTVLHTKQYYSTNLAININESVNGAIPVNLVLLENGENSTIDYVQLKSVLDQHDPNTFVILVMHPQEAHDAFAAIKSQGRLYSPWWYFGTDGVTALEPVEEEPDIRGLLQGEIGIAPYGGDYSNDSSCQEYWTYWQTAGYPGLPAYGIAQSRSYTPYLLDTVQLYFKICDSVVANNRSITALNVWNALKQPFPAFRGCTGWVAIDPLTGSRDVRIQPPIYDLVQFAQLDWEAKGRIQNGQFLTLQSLQRPLGQPSATGGKKSKTGAIAGGIFGVLIALALIVGGCMWWKKKQRNYYSPTSFVRTSQSAVTEHIGLLPKSESYSNGHPYHKMAESSACVKSLISLPKEDSNMDDSSLETLISGTWDRADDVLQSLKDSQSELLSRVQKLKEEWQVDMDLQMKSCDQEIERLNYAHNVEVERLRMELQSRATALKDQLDTLQQNWQLEVAALTIPVANIASTVPKASTVHRKGKI